MKAITQYVGDDGVVYPDRDSALIADRREAFRKVVERTGSGVASPREMIEWIEQHRDEVRAFVGNVSEIARVAKED